MSSSYSLSKQSFKEKLGRSHITLDEQFNISWGNIQQLEGVVDRVRTHMTGYIDAMKALCVSGHAVSDDFKSFYERQPDRLTTISIRYEMIQNGFRTDKIALLERLVNQNVFLRMEELKVELASLRQKVGDREVARKRYDHYLSKITELRDAHSRAKAKGKEKSADLEKLTRNEKKFEDARLEYVAVNHIVTKALWTTWSKRYAIMDPIYAEILKIKTNFTQALANQLQTVIQPLKAQMMIELKEEALPAVFGGGSNQQNGHTGDGDDVHGILSPGGTTEIDSRRLAATIQVANEKLEADARVAATREHEKLTRKATKSGHSAPDMNLGPLDAEEAIGQDVEATTVAPTAAARKTKVLKHPKHAESEESSDSESSEDEEAARRRRKKEKERKKREKEKAAAAAAGLAAPASVAASSSSSTNLDFLADVVSQPQSKPSKKPPTATQPIDLLAFSPMKPPQQEQPQQAQQPFAGNALWDSFSPPPTSTVPASNGPTKGKKNLLELDSFFGSSGALMPPPESQSSAPKTVDPFFDLPSVDQPAAPVDLFAIQPTQSQPQPLIPSSLSRSQSIQPGSTTDPFFAAPSASSNSTMATAKPAPTIAAPGGPTHTSSRSKVTKKNKKADDSESSDSSSDVSSDSDSDQEEGRPTPKRTNKTPSSAAVPSSMPLAVAASAAPLNTSDPFDFDANPTPSQRDAMQHSASGRSTHAANKSATAASNHVQSPKKNTAAPPPPLSAPAPAPAVARVPAPSSPPHLPDLHLGTVSASSHPVSDSPPTGREYSPTRDDFNPHRDGDKQPAPGDPFGGINDPFGENDDL